MGMSNILGALVAFAITASMPDGEILRWGWRLPFFLGLAIVPLGIYLRRTLEETPAFRDERSALRPAPRPLMDVFREHAPALAAGFGISILWAAAVYVLLIYMPVYLQRALSFTAAQAFGGSVLENVVFVAGCFAFGALGDRIGHVRMQACGAAALMVTVIPLFWWLDASRSTPVLMIVLGCLGILAASFTGVAPTVLAGLFPTRVRVTGVSLVYNAGFTIFGGFAPAVLTWFKETAAGSVYAPAWYVALAAIPALLAHRRGSRTQSPALEMPVQES